MSVVVIVIAISWLVLTLWAEGEGPEKVWKIGAPSLKSRVLIVYDPDPFYNLDERACRAFGQAMADSGIGATVATVAAARELTQNDFDVYVFCANTYNWRPDWAVTDFIRHDVMLHARPVVGIVLGAGSTEWSKKAFGRIIDSSGAMLIDANGWQPLRLWSLSLPFAPSKHKRPHLS